MANCRLHEYCGLDDSTDPQGGLCILHSENTQRDKEAFETVLKGQVEKNRTNFTGVVFPHYVNLAYFTFNTPAEFNGAIFNELADFRMALFRQGASFGGATFRKGACFNEARFTEGVSFLLATFDDLADFTKATLDQDAEFTGATFRDRVIFQRTEFHKAAVFRGATFPKKPDFAFSKFWERPDFCGTTFTDGALFGWAEFHKGADFGSAVSSQSHPDARYLTHPQAIQFSRTKFLGDTDFQATSFRGEVNFSQAYFCGKTLFSRGREDAFSGAEVAFQGVVIDPPGSVAFIDADLSKALFLDTDLRNVQFTGATWPRIPSRLRDYLPRLRGRVGVYDEMVISKLTRGYFWDRIERLYRELKQNYEDRRDYERAGDFHYGEKEMRRRNPETPFVLRQLLRLYWLLSGYGERYLRPLFWAGVLLVLSAFGYLVLGLRVNEKGGRMLALNSGSDWLRGIFYSFRVMTLLKPEDFAPIAWAKVAHAVESLLGPLLFGLFALALRQRLRR